jgi:hypothetical protein
MTRIVNTKTFAFFNPEVLVVRSPVYNLNTVGKNAIQVTEASSSDQRDINIHSMYKSFLDVPKTYCEVERENVKPPPPRTIPTVIPFAATPAPPSELLNTIEPVKLFKKPMVFKC